MKPMFDIILRITALCWRRVLENPRSLKGHLAKVSLILFSNLTKERCLGAHHFAKEIIRMGRRSGWLFVSIYCKYAAVALQSAYVGDVRLHQPFPISLTRSGYPRIIPSYHRHVIMKGDNRSDDIVQMYMSFFSLTKAIPLAKRVSQDTFKSIITPLTDDEDSVNATASGIKQLIPTLVSRYIPWVTRIPLRQGITWLPTWKAIPNYKVFKGFGLPKSPYIVWPLELRCFASLLRFIHSRGEQFSPLCLWPHRVRYPLDSDNTIYTNKDLDACEQSFAPHLPTVDGPAAKHFCFGRLGSSVEGRAKRRIFAIGNYICQRLLKPVHEFLMDVLRKLPSDGTFHQTGPLKYIVNKRKYYSYDLSAATDRMPLRCLFYVMEYLFGRSYASAVVNSTLACHRFEVPFVKGKDGVSGVSFVTGQPLGFLSSWPLFALTHHMIVWAAAEVVKPGVQFWDYALLGDDVVIADEDVALSYRRIMEGLKVKISNEKSLISSSGAEFAKRFLVKGLRRDCSPISLKNLMGAYHPLGIASLRMVYPTVPVKVLMRFQGAGYRTLARPISARPKKYIRLADILTQYVLPIDLWLGRGLPLNPYLKAAVISRLLILLKPKDLQLVPDEFIPDEEDVVINPNTGKPGRHDFNSRGFLEYSLLRGQMRLWLNYQRWYCLLILKLETGCDLDQWIKEALDPPIVITNWKVTKEEPLLVKFGYKYKVFDLVGSLGLTWRPGVLAAHPSCLSCQSPDRSSCPCALYFRDLCSVNENVVRGNGFYCFL